MLLKELDVIAIFLKYKAFFQELALEKYPASVMTEKQEHSKKFKIIICSLHSKTFHMEITAQKMKFSIKDSLSKCDQILRKLQ